MRTRDCTDITPEDLENLAAKYDALDPNTEVIMPNCQQCAAGVLGNGSEAAYTGNYEEGIAIMAETIGTGPIDVRVTHNEFDKNWMALNKTIKYLHSMGVVVAWHPRMGYTSPVCEFDIFYTSSSNKIKSYIPLTTKDLAAFWREVADKLRAHNKKMEEYNGGVPKDKPHTEAVKKIMVTALIETQEKQTNEKEKQS